MIHKIENRLAAMEKVSNTMKYNDVYDVGQTVTNVSAHHLLPYIISEKNEPSCKAWPDVAESLLWISPKTLELF